MRAACWTPTSRWRTLTLSKCICPCNSLGLTIPWDWAFYQCKCVPYKLGTMACYLFQQKHKCLISLGNSNILHLLFLTVPKNGCKVIHDTSLHSFNAEKMLSRGFLFVYFCVFQISFFCIDKFKALWAWSAVFRAKMDNIQPWFNQAGSSLPVIM